MHVHSQESTHRPAFSYSLFYLQNRINNYKQTTKSTVCVNYDYATIQEILGKITAHY